MLRRFFYTIQALQGTSSQIEKKKILGDNYEMFLPLLRAVYDPFRQFYLTHETAMKKGIFVLSNQKTDILSILSDLENRRLSGQRACDAWKSFVLSEPQELQTILGQILDKDLECRMGLKMVNAVLKKYGEELIPSYEVALGEAWKGEPVWEEGTTWFASRKFDGVRCSIFLKTGKEPLALSRTGKRFETLEPLLRRFRGYEGPSLMLDGELTLQNKSGRDDFKGITSQIRRKNYQIENVVFHLFDAVKENYPASFSKRAERIKWLIKNWELEDVIQEVQQIPVKDEAHFQRLLSGARERGWEGIMLRKDAPYKGCRSRDLLKVKEMQDLEAKVIGIETD